MFSQVFTVSLVDFLQKRTFHIFSTTKTVKTFDTAQDQEVLFDGSFSLRICRSFGWICCGAERHID